MKLYLYGHDYKYASEQILLTMFPSERPEYPDGRPCGDRLEIRLKKGAVYATAVCSYHRGEEVFRGRAAVKAEKLSDEITTDRYCQRLIKNAVYRAAVSSGIAVPPWGALTGVRPGKLLKGILQNSGSDAEAVSRFCDAYDVSPSRAELCLQTTKKTIAAEESLAPKDICLYVGIPFCPTRCAYCSFVSQSVEKSMKMIPAFFECLLKEVSATAKAVNEQGLRIVSVYFGGGTPTTLSAEQLDELCSALEKEFDLSAIREYTVEAGRPDTITAAKLAVLKAHGVDRVSVNPQTMSDSVLNAIGRRHSSEDIVSALKLVREAGGFAVNMDLIAGLPTDTPEGFDRTLSRVMELEPENITVHTLSLKKGSGITLNGTALPSAEDVGVMVNSARERLAGAGYEPYYLYRQKFMSGGFENVGYSKPGYENLYNICIMEELCSIVAMGGGGSTKLIRNDGGRSIRITEPKYPQEYINLIEKTCEAKQGISDFYNNL